GCKFIECCPEFIEGSFLPDSRRGKVINLPVNNKTYRISIKQSEFHPKSRLFRGSQGTPIHRKTPGGADCGLEFGKGCVSNYKAGAL
ncbi:MAG: hypothetical protein KAW56_14870, partial [Candidatus Marinimicrobia bacterium]|nr:hypothetical protein [Candidatus Neomarinimicrobiota bacterium]